MAIVLNLEASAPRAEGYSVSGTFKLGRAAALPFFTNVPVPVTSGKGLAPQTSPPCYILATLEDTDGEMWELCGISGPGGSPPRFPLSILEYQPESSISYSAVMTKQTGKPGNRGEPKEPGKPHLR